ncbi:MAG: peptidoglycan DD-metalloendopeptidase family protein [Bdellovibrionales bacterium]|nr:peptidoglycan DD-metalloendopeptidase family protein [Bdellovibrionales bacterium]
MIKGSNRFFTILIVPEKTSQVRRIVIPAWLVRGGMVGVLFAMILGSIMILDYWYVMSQIGENKQLKIENRRLRQQVQIFKNKMQTIDATMDRIKTFATRLKVITNIEDRGGLLQSLNDGKLPDANTNIGKYAQTETTDSKEEPSTAQQVAQAAQVAQLKADATGGAGLTPKQLDPSTIFADRSPEEAHLWKEYQELDSRFSELNHESLLIEHVLQDQYELLADKKAFLAALPTRRPAVGYLTSGFGVRRSPTGDRVKMHEGMDIANHIGTPIKATADGTVVFSDVKAGYGQTLIIDHGYGLETWYAHNKKLVARKGERVRRGDTVAQLGNSGRSTGPHCHYEVRINGTPVDPLSYILEN